MAVFKCKICGGTLSINDNDSVAECEYCGTTQTLPKLGGYKDVKEKIAFCKSKTNDENYNKAVALMNEGKNKEAISIFFKIKEHKDSAEKIKTIIQEITVKDKNSSGYSYSVLLNSDGTVTATGEITFPGEGHVIDMSD